MQCVLSPPFVLVLCVVMCGDLLKKTYYQGAQDATCLEPLRLLLATIAAVGGDATAMVAAAAVTVCCPVVAMVCDHHHGSSKSSLD